MIRTNDDPEDPETALERSLYKLAVYALGSEDPLRWQYTAVLFIDYDHATQDWRIRQWKRLAERGVATAIEIVSKVAEIRMVT